jgi:hypothetical protein
VEDEEEFLADEEEEFPEDAPEGELAEEPAEDAAPEEVGDESLEDILATRPEERVIVTEEEEEEAILSLDREERLDTLAVRVVPKQESEFVCQKCHLLKPIRSQLADQKRMYCRDCA